MDIPNVFNMKLKLDICYFKETLISSHNVSGRDLVDVWKKMQMEECAEFSAKPKKNLRRIFSGG